MFSKAFAEFASAFLGTDKITLFLNCVFNCI